jgi:hypothetical protein
MLMNIGNTDIEYHIDYVNKKMHLLDLNVSEINKLTNQIDPTYQRKVIDHEGLLQDLLDFEWICYANDGYVASYLNYNFKILSPKLPYLHKPYLEIIQQRRKRK